VGREVSNATLFRLCGSIANGPQSWSDASETH